jgi:chromosome segregation ATPase
MKESTVTMALNVFSDFGMIEIVDGVITIPNWGKHQSLDQLESKKTYMRNYMKEYREKQKLLTGKTNSKTNVSSADKDIEEEREEEIDKEDIVDKPQKQTRHKYGYYNNVLFTDADLEKLKAEFPDWEQRIERLSEYIASTGKSYKNHLATIRAWARKDNQGRTVGANGIAITKGKSDLDGVF